jgi:hypothetical protein
MVYFRLSHFVYKQHPLGFYCGLTHANELKLAMRRKKTDGK